ncbi:MAG: hypothetical protein MUF49_19680 [Oculatellaceae cyanobacterium Prado106]|nr:hypothetical protein [Oculatellaceae cyanobacterium Prado106]
MAKALSLETEVNSSQPSVTLIQTEQAQPQPLVEGDRPTGIELLHQAFWGLAIGIWFVMIFSLIAQMLSHKHRHNPSQRPSQKSFDTQAIPCRNCRYFSGNPYLYCATRPGAALTQEAIDCQDYCPRHYS